MIRPSKRDNILEAATHLFTQRGFDATSIAEIIVSANTTLSTFYKHFANKVEVYNAVIISYQESLLTAVTVAREGSGDSVETLARMIRMHFLTLSESPLLCAFLRYRFQPASRDVCRIPYKHLEAKLMALYAPVVCKAAQERNLPVRDVADVISLASHSLMGWAGEHLDCNYKIPRMRFADTLQETVRRGCAAR